MKQLLLLAFLVAALCIPNEAKSQTVNLDSLYQVLDEAIDSSEVYLQRKSERITALHNDLQMATTDSQQFERARKLYQEYIPFDNDSAIAYKYRCIDLARQMGRDDLLAETLVQLAEQLTESGFYEEARIHFDEVPQEALTDESREAFLSGMIHLYGEMGYYSHDTRLVNSFYSQSSQLRDSLMARMDSTTASWLQLRTIMLSNDEQLDDAMAYCDRWQQACPPNSRTFATMAFYRAEICRKMGDIDMQRYWLVQSALIDIRNAIMDQGALWSLADSFVSEDRDVDRAHRYIDFSWQCLTRFSTHMRSWLVAPVVTRINDEYKQQLQAANNQLWGAIVAVSILVVGLLSSLFYVSKKRKQLAAARNELKAANSELSEANGQLRHAILLQNDSNRVKDEYIGKFLSICSEYIEKLDGYRLKVNRKLKANQYNDLMRMTNSEQLKEDEVKELFDNFDTVFLHLFPTFIDDFNALLRPEERIYPTGKSRLNTDLRIFALIRLGIDESSKIAEFLRYSPNSIYAYRSRMKGKAAGNREKFEQQVKEIGLEEWSKKSKV